MTDIQANATPITSNKAATTLDVRWHSKRVGMRTMYQTRRFWRYRRLPLDTTLRDDSSSAGLHVRMPMMQIRHMRMRVRDGLMSMLVRMRVSTERLVVIMMQVGVAMQMIMLDFCMRMEMDVPSALQE